MADLKVVNPDGTTTMEGPQPQNNNVEKTFDENNAKALEIEKQIEERQKELAKKKYRVKTTEGTFKYLMNEFYTNVKWNGYECYAISETYKEFKKIADRLKPSKTGKISFTVKVEILEAVFHFIKGYTSDGLENAMKHRLLCEDFSVAMAQLNTDRNQVMEMATEAEAAKHGITVAEYKQAAAAIQAQQNGAPQPNLR